MDNTNPPAFSENTTLLDYFAAKAMQTMITGSNYADIDFDPRLISDNAYKMAKQMLKERWHFI